MSGIHYFQRYSQKENVVTNNTLLLFSRLYSESPLKFKLFLNELLDDFQINVGVDFQQQMKSKSSIPDGSITQESFKLSIETKLSDNFDISQLVNHFDSFGNENTQVLIGLGPKSISPNKENEIKKELKKYNENENKRIQFISLTFENIINSFIEVTEQFDFELRGLIEDYEQFCLSQK